MKRISSRTHMLRTNRAGTVNTHSLMSTARFVSIIHFKCFSTYSKDYLPFPFLAFISFSGIKYEYALVSCFNMTFHGHHIVHLGK